MWDLNNPRSFIRYGDPKEKTVVSARPILMGTPGELYYLPVGTPLTLWTPPGGGKPYLCQGCSAIVLDPVEGVDYVFEKKGEVP